MIILFDSKEKRLGRLSSFEVHVAEQKEEINGLITFEFEIYRHAIGKMANASYVAHRDLRNKHSIMMYKIINSMPSEFGYMYKCIHIAHDEFNSYGYVREKRMENTTAESALLAALEGSRWEIGKVVDTELKPCYFYDNSRLECISKILETWDVEIQYRIVSSGTKIIGRYVDLARELGEVTGKRYVYGSNALEVIKEESQTGLYTAIIPRGKGEKKEDSGGYGRRINIKSVAWSKSKGDPLNKPSGQEYLEIPEMSKQFGYPDGTPRYKVEVYSDLEDPEDLINAAYLDLVKNSRPLVQFKSKIREGDILALGDTVGIIRRDLNIFYKTRVFKVVRDIKTETTIEVELGDKVVKKQADFNKRVRKDISNAADDLKNDIDKSEKSQSDKLQEMYREVDKHIEDLNDRLSTDISAAENTLGESIASAVKHLQKMITDSMFDDNANWYFLEMGNKYGYAPGFYTLNRPIDQRPTKGVFIGGGKMGISNTVGVDGRLKWTTWATGDGIVADAIKTGNLNASLLKSGTIDANLIRTGYLRGGKVEWNLNTGEFNIGDDLRYRNGVLGIDGALLVKEINGQSSRIGGSNLTLNGSTEVRGDFKVSGNALFGTINADNIRVTNLNANNINGGTLQRPYDYGKMSNGSYDYRLDGNSVAFNGNSSYITITDRGGRGQVDINGTVAARGSGYVYELNAGGLHGRAGSMIGQNYSVTSLYGPGMSGSPSITIDSSGTVNIGRLYVNGRQITG